MNERSKLTIFWRVPAHSGHPRFTRAWEALAFQGTMTWGLFLLAQANLLTATFAFFERRRCHFTKQLVRIVSRGSVHSVPRDQVFPQRRVLIRIVPLPRSQRRHRMEQSISEEATDSSQWCLFLVCFLCCLLPSAGIYDSDSYHRALK